MKLELITLAVIAAFVAIFAYTSSTGNHEWGGADDQPEDVIKGLTGGSFQPWFSSVWRPPSAEIESLLFALQAAIGAIIIGYFLGYNRAMAKMKTKIEQEDKDKGLDAQPAR
jgi:cobalt/nickel transport protein